MHQLVHSVALKDLQVQPGQGLSEAVLPGTTDVQAFVLTEKATKQETLLRGHHTVVQLHLRGPEGSSRLSLVLNASIKYSVIYLRVEVSGSREFYSRDN